MIDFRPTDRRCAKKDCDKAAAFMPVISIWAKGWSPGLHPPATMKLGLGVCADHRDLTAKQLLKDPGGRAQIVKAFRHGGKADPDFSTAKVDWEAYVQ